MHYYNVCLLTPSCNRLVPEQKIQGKTVPGPIFSNIMPRIDFCYTECCNPHVAKQHKTP